MTANVNVPFPDLAATKPREAGKFIYLHAKHVLINKEEVKNIAKIILPELQKGLYSVKKWREHKLHPKTLDESTINWIFVLDTLNFSFWAEDGAEPFTVKYHDECYTGYWGLCAAINRALEDGIPFTTPSYYLAITEKELQHIFRSETTTQIPLLAQRTKNLNETGKILTEQYQNSFVNILRSCDKSASTLLTKIIKLFPCFQDEATFHERQVAFYKRAQILIADLWGCFEGEGYGEFKDIDSLTMFADYLVPRGLQFLNILSYSDELRKTIESGMLLPSGSLYEVEIRGCSIHAVDLICKELCRMSEENNLGDITINSVLVDFFLWDYSKEHEKELTQYPMHKTRSIFY